jgi:hypothetical protein
MNGNTLVRMRTLFGTMDSNEVIDDRHIAIQDIPEELTWQAHHCHLDGDIRVIKLTLETAVEQPPSVDQQDEPEEYPVYGVPDLSPFYD